MPTPDWYDRSELDRRLRRLDLDAFADSIARLSEQRLDQPTNGDLRRWSAALAQLPPRGSQTIDASTGVVRVLGEQPQPETLRETLMAFHPWRKGPFEVLGIGIDTEWRSDWKWDRIVPRLDLCGKSVLDVGCGNGYYGWRMLDAGAEWVLGMDPILRFVLQFEVLRRYAPRPDRHFVVPLVDSDLPDDLAAFDVAFSMGVLYHRTGPIDHLRTMAGALRRGGTLVLETLIVESESAVVLCPEDRYAQMRNVWFLPSIAMLHRWLRRTGFEDIEVIDITATTTDEQRSTSWMTFQSLADFLDPVDSTKTIEGYPAPVRATVLARRS